MRPVDAEQRSRACVILAVTPAGPVEQEGTDRMAVSRREDDPMLGIVQNPTGGATGWCRTD